MMSDVAVTTSGAYPSPCSCDEPDPFGDYVYECALCSFLCTNQDEFQSHIYAEHRSNFLPCISCGKLYSTSRCLVKHIEYVHKGLLVYCCGKENCNFKTTVYTAFLFHLVKCVSSSFPCYYCKTTFSTPESLIVHLECRQPLKHRNGPPSTGKASVSSNKPEAKPPNLPAKNSPRTLDAKTGKSPVRPKKLLPKSFSLPSSMSTASHAQASICSSALLQKWDLTVMKGSNSSLMPMSSSLQLPVCRLESAADSGKKQGPLSNQRPLSIRPPKVSIAPLNNAVPSNANFAPANPSPNAFVLPKNTKIEHVKAFSVKQGIMKAKFIIMKPPNKTANNPPVKSFGSHLPLRPLIPKVKQSPPESRSSVKQRRIAIRKTSSSSSNKSNVTLTRYVQMGQVNADVLCESSASLPRISKVGSEHEILASLASVQSGELNHTKCDFQKDTKCTMKCSDNRKFDLKTSGSTFNTIDVPFVKQEAVDEEGVEEISDVCSASFAPCLPPFSKHMVSKYCSNVSDQEPANSRKDAKQTAGCSSLYLKETDGDYCSTESECVVVEPLFNIEREESDSDTPTDCAMGKESNVHIHERQVPHVFHSSSLDGESDHLISAHGKTRGEVCVFPVETHGRYQSNQNHEDLMASIPPLAIKKEKEVKDFEDSLTTWPKKDEMGCTFSYVKSENTKHLHGNLVDRFVYHSRVIKKEIDDSPVSLKYTSNQLRQSQNFANHCVINSAVLFSPMENEETILPSPADIPLMFNDSIYCGNSSYPHSDGNEKLLECSMVSKSEEISHRNYLMSSEVEMSAISNTSCCRTSVTSDMCLEDSHSSSCTIISEEYEEIEAPQTPITDLTEAVASKSTGPFSPQDTDEGLTSCHVESGTKNNCESEKSNQISKSGNYTGDDCCSPLKESEGTSTEDVRGKAAVLKVTDDTRACSLLDKTECFSPRQNTPQRNSCKLSSIPAEIASDEVLPKDLPAVSSASSSISGSSIRELISPDKLTADPSGNEAVCSKVASLTRYSDRTSNCEADVELLSDSSSFDELGAPLVIDEGNCSDSNTSETSCPRIPGSSVIEMPLEKKEKDQPFGLSPVAEQEVLCDTNNELNDTEINAFLDKSSLTVRQILRKFKYGAVEKCYGDRKQSISEVAKCVKVENHDNLMDTEEPSIVSPELCDFLERRDSKCNKSGLLNDEYEKPLNLVISEGSNVCQPKTEIVDQLGVEKEERPSGTLNSQNMQQESSAVKSNESKQCSDKLSKCSVERLLPNKISNRPSLKFCSSSSTSKEEISDVNICPKTDSEVKPTQEDNATGSLHSNNTYFLVNSNTNAPLMFVDKAKKLNLLLLKVAAKDDLSVGPTQNSSTITDAYNTEINQSSHPSAVPLTSNFFNPNIRFPIVPCTSVAPLSTALMCPQDVVASVPGRNADMETTVNCNSNNFAMIASSVTGNNAAFQNGNHEAFAAISSQGPLVKFVSKQSDDGNFSTHSNNEAVNVKNMTQYLAFLKQRKSDAGLLKMSSSSDFFKCMYQNCAYTTNSPSVFSIHYSGHAVSSIECAYCLKVFSGVSNLIEHSIRAHRRRVFQCSLCFYRACSKTHVHFHLQTYHPKSKGSVITGVPIRMELGSLPEEPLVLNIGIKIIKCAFDKCAFSSNSITDMSYHVWKHPERPAPLSCQECTNKYAAVLEWVTHLKVHDIYLLHCMFCSYGCNKRPQMLNHLTSRHADYPLMTYVRTSEQLLFILECYLNANKNTPFKSIQCCSSPSNCYCYLLPCPEFEGNSNRINHLLENVKIKRMHFKAFECLYCDIKASSIAKMEKHLKMEHLEETQLKYYHCMSHSLSNSDIKEMFDFHEENMGNTGSGSLKSPVESGSALSVNQSSSPLELLAKESYAVTTGDVQRFKLSVVQLYLSRARLKIVYSKKSPHLSIHLPSIAQDTPPSIYEKIVKCFCYKIFSHSSRSVYFKCDYCPNHQRSLKDLRIHWKNTHVQGGKKFSYSINTKSRRFHYSDDCNVFKIINHSLQNRVTTSITDIAFQLSKPPSMLKKGCFAPNFVKSEAGTVSSLQYSSHVNERVQSLCKINKPNFSSAGARMSTKRHWQICYSEPPCKVIKQEPLSFNYDGNSLSFNDSPKNVQFAGSLSPFFPHLDRSELFLGTTIVVYFNYSPSPVTIPIEYLERLTDLHPYVLLMDAKEQIIRTHKGYYDRNSHKK